MEYKHFMFRKLFILCLIFPLSACDAAYGIMFVGSALNPAPRIHYHYALARAKQGDPKAQTEVADILQNACHPMPCQMGWSPPCDKRACGEWYRKAAENGYAEAQMQLGDLYSRGADCDIKADPQEAIKWYLSAARQEHIPAYVRLAKKEQLAGNDAAAAGWYQKAANKDDKHSQDALAEMYLSGKGVSRDTRKALEYKIKAAQDGGSFRQFRLGEFYTQMEPPDYKEAYYWTSIARFQATGGFTDEFEKHLTAEQRTRVDARIEQEIIRACKKKIKTIHQSREKLSDLRKQDDYLDRCFKLSQYIDERKNGPAR